MATLNDELLAHHISTIKHGAELGASVKPYLKEMKAIIRKEVAAFDSEARTKARLEKLLKDLVNVLSKHATGWEKQLIEDLKAFAEYEVNYQADTISDWVNVDLVNPSLAQVWAAAEFEPLDLGTGPIDFNKMIDDWGEDEVSRLVMGVKTGFVQGHSVRRIIKDVTGAGGLADISQRNAEAVAHTAVAHVSSEARMETYKENADIIIGFEWVSTLDSRTSDICRSRDGQKFLWDDKVKPKPPAHYRCRSTTVPLLDDEFAFLDEGAQRASKGAEGGKPVSADLTYYSWLKQQPAAFQDEVLGKTKGLIFRNSGLTPEEFRALSTDDLGRGLTLEEMKARDERVAAYLDK